MKFKLLLLAFVAIILAGCASNAPKVVLPEPIAIPKKTPSVNKDRVSFIGYVLNEELSDMRECRIKEGSLSRWNGRGIIFEYDYVGVATEKCFMRRIDNIANGREVNDEWIQMMGLSDRDIPSYLHIPTLTVVNKRIAEVSVLTRGLYYQELIYADLVNKYGAPKSKSSSVNQNKMGAKFDVISAIWKLSDGVEIVFFGALDTITHGKIIVSTEDGRKYQDAQRKEQESKRPKL